MLHRDYIASLYHIRRRLIWNHLDRLRDIGYIEGQFQDIEEFCEYMSDIVKEEE